MLNRSEPFYARVICNQKTTLTLLLWWDEKRCGYVIHEEGSDLILEISGSDTIAYRLADMYLDGFREGYDRGYACAEAEHTVRNAERLDRVRRRRVNDGDSDPYRIRRNPGTFTRPTEGDGRDRDDDQGHTEGDRPSG